MDDIFNEFIVKKQLGGKEYLYKALIAAAAIVIIALGIVFADIMVILIIGGVFFGVYYAYKQFEIEYEYILTNEELDIDKIIAREKRKHLFTVKVTDFVVLAPYTDENRREYSDTGILKRIDVSSSSASVERWFAIYTQDKVKTLLIFEPPYKMREGIEKLIPRKVKK